MAKKWNENRFWWAVLAVWAVTFVSDWVFHGIWLQPWYHQTAKFWRPMGEMQKMMPWMWFGQMIFSWAFVWIYSKGISKENQWHQAFRYGLAFLLVAKVPEQLMQWATSPYPAQLVIRWGVIAAVQAWASAFVMTWAYKPLSARAAA